ncbi:MAG: aminotransferase class V-fold PLP-dependent enzyme [Candidatus Nanohalobium sp.]
MKEKDFLGGRSMALNPENYREDFPVLEEKAHGEKIVYFDNAATTHTPEQVLQRVNRFYREENSNEGRSLHKLANKATKAYDQSRKVIADFIGAETDEIVFAKNTTEAVNKAAYGLDIQGKILAPKMAHHSEQLPWRRKAEREGLEFEFIPTSNGSLDLDAAKKLIGEDTGLVSIPHVSNVFGCRNPVEELTEIAHDNNALIFVDGAQSVPRMPVDVKDLDIDLMAFSGHKMCGPFGTGALYGKMNVLEEMRPYNVGGGMIESVETDNVEWCEVPNRFEAGTPNIAGAVGFAEAAKYIQDVGIKKIDNHERRLNKRIVEGLEQVEGLKPYTPEDETPSVVSFTMEEAHPHDVAEVLNHEGVAVRAGHHCAQPQVSDLDVSGTVRASPYLYNTENEVDRFLKAVKEVKKVF